MLYLTFDYKEFLVFYLDVQIAQDFAIRIVIFPYSFGLVKLIPIYLFSEPRKIGILIFQREGLFCRFLIR